jgi:WD40 repeat protein
MPILSPFSYKIVVVRFSFVPGMLATCSVNKTVTIWDTYNVDKTIPQQPPKAIISKDMRVGKLYTVNFYPSSPWLLGCAGSAKEIAIWDMTQDNNVQSCFGGRTSTSTIPMVQPIVGKQEAFDAMMTSSSQISSGEANGLEKPSTKSKKKGTKKKKKVHKAGR